jgi:lysine 2,3-aminomutase
MSAADINSAIAYIASNDAIFEVILTGGDPLVLSPRRIADITQRLAAIPHVAVLRWHSRIPVVSPERITPELITALRSSDAAVYLGLHTNHARELTPEARRAIARLVDAGIVVLSQTVLLKGINDNAETLADLFRELIKLRVKPYYLHHADMAPGTSHFRTTLAAGQDIMRQLRATLSGIAQPTYVIDIPGGVAKVPAGPSYVSDAITDPWGSRHALPQAPRLKPPGSTP